MIIANLTSCAVLMSLRMLKTNKTNKTNNRVSFSSESGQIVLDESFLKKKVNKREFDFLGFNDNFELIPVKMASSYEVMTTIILFDRMIKS